MHTFADIIEEQQIAPDWAAALAPIASQIELLFRRADRASADGATVLPARENVLRVFRKPLADVRVLIVGQDPYPSPGHAVGLAFSTARNVRPLPRSLANMYRELQDDLGIAPADHGDLSSWEAQGVMLCNRVFTVAAHNAGGHDAWGWQQVSDTAIRALQQRGGPLVAVLWGKKAQQLSPLLAGIEIIESAHPSPLSARTGFFGSRPFSRVNAALEQQGAVPIDWRVR